jgi:hypothetical protein
MSVWNIQETAVQVPEQWSDTCARYVAGRGYAHNRFRRRFLRQQHQQEGLQGSKLWANKSTAAWSKVIPAHRNHRRSVRRGLTCNELKRPLPGSLWTRLLIRSTLQWKLNTLSSYPSYMVYASVQQEVLSLLSRDHLVTSSGGSFANREHRSEPWSDNRS